MEASTKTRTARSTERLTLVSPVLLHVHRVWRFISPIGEFSYLMEDENFLADLLTGKRRLTMKEGIQITANVETDEVFEGGGDRLSARLAWCTRPPVHRGLRPHADQIDGVTR